MATQAVIELLLKDKRFQQALSDAQKQSDKLKKSLGDKNADPFAKLKSGASSFADDLLKATKAAGALAAAAAGIAVAYGLKKAIEEANDAQKALTGAANAMARTGEYSRAAMLDVEAFADGLFKAKGVAGDLGLEMFSLAKSYGVSNEQAKLAVSVATDLSAATGRDLKTSVEQVTQSFNGKIGALAKLNPELAKLSAQELAAGKAAEILGRQFDGAAAAQLGTFGGAIGHTNEQLNDMLGELGNVVVQNPVVIKLIQDLGEGFDKLGEYIKDNKEEIMSFVNEGLIDVIKQLGTSVRAFEIGSKAFKATAKAMDVLSESSDKAKKSIYEQRTVVQDIVRGYGLMALGVAKLLQAWHGMEIFQKIEKARGDEATARYEKNAKAIDELVQSLEVFRKEIELAPGTDDPFKSVRESANDAQGATESLSDAILNIAKDLEKTNGKKATVYIEPVNTGGTQKTGDTYSYDNRPKGEVGPDKKYKNPDKFEDGGKYGPDAKVLSELGAGIASAIISGMNTGGVEGAAQAVSGTVGKVLETFAGKMGGWIGAIVEAIQFAMQDPAVHDAKVQSFAEGLPTALDNLNKNIESMPEIMGKAMPAVVEQLIAGFPDFVGALLKSAPRLVKALVKGLPPAIRDALKEWGQEIVAGFAYNMSKLGGFFKKMNLDLDKFQDQAHEAGTRFSNAVKSVGPKFREWATTAGAAFKKGVSDAAGEFSRALQGAARGISFEWGNLKNGIAQIGPKLEASAQKAGAWLTERAFAASQWFINAGERISAAWQTVIGKFGELGQSFSGLKTGIEDYFKTKFPETVASIGREVKKFFTDLFTGLGDAGTQFYNAIIQGAQDFVDMVTGQGSGGGSADVWEKGKGWVEDRTGVSLGTGSLSLTGNSRAIVPLKPSALSAGSSGMPTSRAPAPASSGSSGADGAAIQRLIDAIAGQSQEITVEVKISEDVLGKAILNLSRRNVRIAT